MRYALLLVMAAASGCDRDPDYTAYRAGIQQRLPSASTVEFASEKVRTLWSEDGRRINLYCAEVKPKNGFGDAMGIYYASYTIFDKGLPKYLSTKPGTVYLDNRLSINHYLDCVRSDTKRPNNTLGKAYFTLSEKFSPTEGDEVEPVLSNQLAPELR
jgi:hypothetical protein